MTKREYLQLIREKMQEVKNFNITTYKKAYHKTQLENLRQLYYSLTEVNRYLFDPDCYEFTQYKLNIICNKSKKELDGNLNYCITSIKSQLAGIFRDTENNLITFEQ